MQVNVRLMSSGVRIRGDVYRTKSCVILTTTAETGQTKQRTSAADKVCMYVFKERKRNYYPQFLKLTFSVMMIAIPTWLGNKAIFKMPLAEPTLSGYLSSNALVQRYGTLSPGTFRPTLIYQYLSANYIDFCIGTL